jgi:hypothetical protein
MPPAHAGAVLCRHLPAEILAPPSQPEGKRVPFGWRALAITVEPTLLRWPALPADVRPTRLRLTVAIDLKGERYVEASLAGSGRVLGIFDVRNAAVLQPCEIPLLADDAADLCREGVALRLIDGNAPLWVLLDGAGIDDAHRPHLLVPGSADALSEFHVRFTSLASVQQFGWMEGCVLDGLLDLSDLPGRTDARAVAQRHLDLFIRGDRLVYEGPENVPADGAIYGIEGTLPFAALARLQPAHPLLELPLAWWRKESDHEGAVIDWISTTSEGSYTVGYPLALIARQRRDEALERMALTQVRLRQARLFVDGAFWRLSRSDGTRANRNWARGLAWHLLGAVRTLGVLHHRTDSRELIADLARLAEWSQSFQRRDGLWSVFIDEPGLTHDTAGSAGIAAALAIGANQGLFPAGARDAARRALPGLVANLTADGFLGGVSPSNKGGEELQRSSYRILYPMGMGLVAQLIAALARR